MLFKKTWKKLVFVLCTICAVALALGGAPTDDYHKTYKATVIPFEVDHGPASLTELRDAGAAIDNRQDLLDPETGLLTLPRTQSAKAYAANSGGSLHAVVQTLRKQNYESAVGFSISAQKLFDYTNRCPWKVVGSALHRANFLELDGTLSIHNHPSCQAFSAQDLYAEALFNTPIAMVVTDRYVYTVQPKSGEWADPQALKDYCSSQQDLYLKRAQSYLDSINHTYRPDKILSAPRTPDNGSYQWFWQEEIRKQLQKGNVSSVSVSTGIWVTDQAMRQTARKFNLLYTRVETDYFNAGDYTVFVPVARLIETATVARRVEPMTFGGTKHGCLPAA